MAEFKGSINNESNRCNPHHSLYLSCITVLTEVRGSSVTARRNAPLISLRQWRLCHCLFHLRLLMATIFHISLQEKWSLMTEFYFEVLKLYCLYSRFHSMEGWNCQNQKLIKTNYCDWLRQLTQTCTTPPPPKKKYTEINFNGIQ